MILSRPGSGFQLPCLIVCLHLLACVCPLHSTAQQAGFVPNTEDDAFLQQLSLRYEQQYKQTLTGLPSANRKDYENLYKARWDNIKEKFTKKEIYTEAAAQQYLDALVNEIVQKNPVLKDKSLHCYFSRSGIPNASYIGEGIILVNMGLFTRLQDENQAAFVLAHEMAHFLLQHGEHAIERYVTTINSDEVQQELRKIKKSEYRKQEQVEKLVKGLTFNSRRHSRDHESEADSMAVELMHATRFSVSGALTTLALLDKIDQDTLSTAAVLEKLFNAPGYPFQKKWLAREEGLLGGHAKLSTDGELDDSLKTHPNCQSRIRTLQPLVSRYQQATATTHSATFETLKNTFRYEVIVYDYASDDYTGSFYRTLKLLQQQPADPFLIAQIGKLLNSLYAAQKSHTLSRYIDMPTPGYPEGYNTLLQFVQNLYIENFASISYHFLKQYHPQLDNYEPFKTAYSGSIMIAQQ